MVRKANAQDNTKIMEYLKAEQSINLFIIGDIENFGYDNDFLNLWIELDSFNNIKAVLLRYYGSFIPYSKTEFNVNAFARIIKESKTFEMLSGKSGITEEFEGIDGVNIGQRRPMYLCELKSGENIIKTSDAQNIRKGTYEDIDRLLDLRQHIAEFAGMGSTRESMEKTFETNSGRTFYIEEDGIVVSAASTTAENSMSAMVVGVCTHPEYREKGYASLCVNALCSELLKEGKTLCLFYDNPKAGSIYKRIGFKDIGIWNMYKK